MDKGTWRMTEAEGAIEVALCRSLLYEALSIGFREPTAETIERITTSAAATALASAASVIDADREARAQDLQRGPEAAVVQLNEGTPKGELSTGRGSMSGGRSARSGLDLGGKPAGGVTEAVPTGSLADLAASLVGCPGIASLGWLALSHARVFGHSVRGGAAPYETEYGSDTLFMKPHELGDIAGFLRAFGLRPAPEGHERIDHVSCELEFVSFLSRKEAHALETGDREMLEATRNSARLFLKDHLGQFAPAFARAVERVDPDGFYGRLATLLREFVRSEAERFEVPLGSEMLRLRVDLDDGAPIACGSETGCAPGACGVGSDPSDAGSRPERSPLLTLESFRGGREGGK